MRYRRADVKGGTYFFTVNLADRKQALLVDEFEILRSVINKVKKQHPFQLDAMVVLPEHLHAILTLPVDDNDFAKRWMLIKTGFSRQLPKHERINDSRKSKGERGIWQRRYWEHVIRDELDFERHVNYIHYNPVKHGYVKRAIDWPNSTIHEYIRKGILNVNGEFKFQVHHSMNQKRLHEASRQSVPLTQLSTPRSRLMNASALFGFYLPEIVFNHPFS